MEGFTISRGTPEEEQEVKKCKWKDIVTDKIISDNRAVCNPMAKYLLIQNNNQVLDFLHVHFVPVEPINDAIGLCELGYR